MLLLEGIAEARAHLDDRRHVDLVEGRQHGRGVLRFLEPFGDAPAQPGHRHALLARAGRCRLGGRERGRRRIAGGFGCGGEMCQHVALGQPPAFSGSGDCRGVEPVLVHQLAYRGRQRRFGRGRRRLGSGGGTRSRRATPAGRLDRAQYGSHFDGLALGHLDRAEHSGGGGGHFQGDLVGLQLDEGLVDRDRVAGRFEPLGNRRLGHRFAERGYHDLGCHRLLSPPAALRRL